MAQQLWANIKVFLEGLCRLSQSFVVETSTLKGLECVGSVPWCISVSRHVVERKRNMNVAVVCLPPHGCHTYIKMSYMA